MHGAQSFHRHDATKQQQWILFTGDFNIEGAKGQEQTDYNY